MCGELLCRFIFCEGFKCIFVICFSLLGVVVCDVIVPELEFGRGVLSCKFGAIDNSFLLSVIVLEEILSQIISRLFEEFVVVIWAMTFRLFEMCMVWFSIRC